MVKKKTIRIDSFDLQPGRVIARKYEIVNKLGTGWEGEVYSIIELSTGIEKAAKFFFPQRNMRNRTASHYAKKLHRLRHCPIVMQYHTQEIFTFRKIPITVMISEYVKGQILSEFIKHQPGKKLIPFQAIHFLYALVQGLEPIHHLGEYHGDLHEDNIIISRYGLGFELKLLDTFYWPQSRKLNIQEDLIDAVRIFYDTLGGQRYYARQPKVIKYICCGLKRGLILSKFKNASQLREHLESMNWED